MLDVTDIIRDPDVGTQVTIDRTLKPVLVHGRAGKEITVSAPPIIASVQPMPTRELAIMPEGLRNQGVVVVFSQIELLTLPMPDTFTYLGAKWQIFEVHDWNATAGYWHSLATRVTQT